MKSWPLFRITRITRLDRQSLATAHWPSGCENIHSVSRPCAIHPESVTARESESEYKPQSPSVRTFPCRLSSVREHIILYRCCTVQEGCLMLTHLGHHKDTALSKRPVGGDAFYI